MNLLFLNLVLALLWGMVTADLSLPNLVFGFVLGFGSLWLMRYQFNQGSFNRASRVLRLAVLFLTELVLSSVRVARDTLSPSMSFRPAIIAVPLDAKTAVEITALANLISLTPGTLSVDVSDDCSTLYIHAMHVDDPEALRRDIKEGFERKVIDAFGKAGGNG